MQDIFEIIYHFISGCTFGIKTGIYYLAQVPSHLNRFYDASRRFISVIPAPWGSILGFTLVGSIACAFLHKRGA